MEEVPTLFLVIVVKLLPFLLWRWRTKACGLHWASIPSRWHDLEFGRIEETIPGKGSRCPRAESRTSQSDFNRHTEIRIAWRCSTQGHMGSPQKILEQVPLVVHLDPWGGLCWLLQELLEMSSMKLSWRMLRDGSPQSTSEICSSLCSITEW